MELAIGIDMGGTKIQGILMNRKGKIHKNYRRPTEAYKSRSKIIDNIVEVIKKLKTKGVLGVGIGTPGFARLNGRMTNLPNLPKLNNFDLRKELDKKTRMRIYLENDANCFALAEHKLGAARGTRHSIGIILGTGVGSGIIINDKLYRGAIGGAGGSGHSYIVVDKKVKDVEELISGPNIVRRYEKLSGKRAHPPRVILKKGDKIGKKVYDETVLFVGLYFTNLINTFNPDCIVVGGGVSNLPFYKDIQKVVNKYANPFMAKACKIKKHAIGDDAGVIGAAELVFCD